MQLAAAESLSRIVRKATWFGELQHLAQSMRLARGESGRLLVAGDPDDEPWHLTAHLEAVSKFRGLPELRPTLVKGDGITQAGRSDTVLFVSERPVPARLLEQLQDARSQGSTVLGLAAGKTELPAVAHESVVLDLAALRLSPSWLVPDFEVATHLFGVAVSRPVRSPGGRVSRLLRRGDAGW